MEDGLKTQSLPTRVWNQFRSDRLALASVAFLALLAMVAAVFLVLRWLEIPWPYDPSLPALEQKLQPPSWAHWMGTDNLGRDVLTRLLHGSYISLTVGFVVVGVILAIGVTVGALAGYWRGWVDGVLMRIVDSIMCFPTFFLILTVVAVLGPKIWIVMLVIGLVSWTGTARLVRAEFLSLRENQYVAAARALGESHFRIMFRHILPNALAPILVTAVLEIPGAILIEASLSFLGFGVQPPRPTWGNIITDGKTYFLEAWWLILFPGIAILVTTLAFYLAGDGLREAVNVRKTGK
jgi:peptide/nickel transport system permease protein